MKKFSLQGILEIEAFGTYLEEYMTELISSGLKIWNLRNENGIIYFNCQRHKYKKIVKKAREYNVKAKYISKIGLYFKIRPYFKRYGILMGVIGFLFSVFLLSNFIWDIRITGNEVISNGQITEILEDSGIHIGTSIHKIDNEYAELSAMLELEELSWISIERDGSRILVKVSERLTGEEPGISINTPCNIIAEKTGRIINTEVYRGRLLYTEGSGVNKGDIIVSGTVDDGGGNILLQHADAKIIAECEDISEFFVPFDAIEKKKNGEIIEHKYIIFLGTQIPLFLNSSFPESSRYHEEFSYFNILGFKTPFKIKTTYYEELEEVNVAYTNGMALQKLEELIDNYKKAFFTDCEITSEDTEFIPGDNGINAVLKITYLTDIAVKDEIRVK